MHKADVSRLTKGVTAAKSRLAVHGPTDLLYNKARAMAWLGILAYPFLALERIMEGIRTVCTEYNCLYI